MCVVSTAMEAWRKEPKTRSKGTGTRISLKPPARQEENQEGTMWGSLEKGGLQGELKLLRDGTPEIRVW